MKVISTNQKYKCPYCGTVVQLEWDDIGRWNEVYYYHCPTCYNTPHIKGGNNCPYDIKGKKAIEVD